MNDFTPFIPWIGGLLGLLSLLAGLRANRRKRLLQNLPTSKTTGVFIGLVELKGTAESEAPLRSHLAEIDCVHHHWSVQEHWSRTVTESYTDSDGKSQTRTRHESGWKTVDSGGGTSPFYLQDDVGAVLVRPDGAKLEPAPVFNQTCNRSDPLYYAKGPATSIMDSDHRRRFTESAIPLHHDVYVVGRAREREDMVAPEIAADTNAAMFLISTKSEDQVTSGFAFSAWGWTLFGLILTVASLIGHDVAKETEPATRVPVYLAAAAGFALVWSIGWVWTVFNSLVDLRNRVRQAWAQVEVQLKRRHDLIPNLLNIVNGLKDHEREVQTELTALRGQQQATPPGEAGPEIHGIQSTLIAIQEKYPQLKTSEAFLDLQRGLADTENRIALARDYFNNIATHYNTRIEHVPDCHIAALGGMKPRPLLHATDFERQSIQFSFAD